MYILCSLIELQIYQYFAIKSKYQLKSNRHTKAPFIYSHHLVRSDKKRGRANGSAKQNTQARPLSYLFYETIERTMARHLSLAHSEATPHLQSCPSTYTVQLAYL
ncbi:hypothetical protein IX318_001828 [Porphyromonas levii]|nr:hypothetical protein [Porphyromonas levii]MBR8715953.1 hypothetical protein [Porphyromonas levii]MBR8728482.1 hypothetical protein [Porphyromonas levii]MBR8736807.1 hypothetical protein [Porphyromonas levii]MBR8778857.1 hypothetical protein [Porphyromonas levii]